MQSSFLRSHKFGWIIVWIVLDQSIVSHSYLMVSRPLRIFIIHVLI